MYFSVQLLLQSGLKSFERFRLQMMDRHHMTLTAFGGYLQTAVRVVATLTNFQASYYLFSKEGEEIRENY